MVLTDLVLSKSRAPVSFIKHLFIFGLFNTPRHGYRGLSQCRSELEISCEGYRRSCGVATARVRTRRHTTLLSERGSFTDGICEAPPSLESQAVSLPGRQDYKPVQKHFVNIFSTAPQDRLNSADWMTGGWSTLSAVRSFRVPHPSLRVRVLTLFFFLLVPRPPKPFAPP